MTVWKKQLSATARSESPWRRGEERRGREDERARARERFHRRMREARARAFLGARTRLGALRRALAPELDVRLEREHLEERVEHRDGRGEREQVRVRVGEQAAHHVVLALLLQAHLLLHLPLRVERRLRLPLEEAHRRVAHRERQRVDRLVHLDELLAREPELVDVPDERRIRARARARGGALLSLIHISEPTRPY